jgi:hypothetical protein
MNNLTTIREFFQLGLKKVSHDLGLTDEELVSYESGEQQPTPEIWQKFTEYYADLFHVAALPESIAPIHFRLSVDYLMNIGVTINDLIAFKWYFENTRPELGQFTIALYSVDGPIIERLTSDLPTVIEDFAGYILLNNDGTMNQFIDERNNDHVSDWRFILYKNENRIVDVTPELITFDYLVNYTII